MRTAVKTGLLIGLVAAGAGATLALVLLGSPPPLEMVSSTSCCRVARVHLGRGPGKYSYRVIVRRESQRLARHPSTRPRVIAPAQYARLTGDGAIETTTAKEEVLWNLGRQDMDWRAIRTIDVALVPPWVFEHDAREPNQASVFAVSAGFEAATGGGGFGARELPLPYARPLSLLVTFPDRESRWQADRLPLHIITGSDTPETTWRVQLILARAKK